MPQWEGTLSLRAPPATDDDEPRRHQWLQSGRGWEGAWIPPGRGRKGSQGLSGSFWPAAPHWPSCGQVARCLTPNQFPEEASWPRGGRNDCSRIRAGRALGTSPRGAHSGPWLRDTGDAARGVGEGPPRVEKVLTKATWRVHPALAHPPSACEPGGRDTVGSRALSPGRQAHLPRHVLSPPPQTTWLGSA